ncbi:MAG TPA: hypothetical protein K8V56_10605 [Sporosarcina psychrophila]|uniref:Uncharacterized protein n=1 Tax=Sporosarcina psychrophila TaxID=1476 RepID=A0A921FYV1_SPOPS|nr:hypothetical protein [Sporosarcina psychrophila]
MDFKDKIRLHNYGRISMSDELINLALSDVFSTTMINKPVPVPYTDEILGDIILQLPRWRPGYSEGVTFEEKIARNLKVMISRHTKTANKIRDKKSFEGTQLQMMQGEDPLHHIYTLMVEFDHQYYKDDFDKVPEQFFKEIEKRYGTNFEIKIRNEFKPFLDVLSPINREKQRLLDEYIPLIKEALDECMLKVDLNRSEMDIVAYIANGVRWKVSRKLTKLLGTKVHQIKGKKYFVTKRDIRSAKFIRTKPNDILKVDTNKLSSAQYVFFEKLIRCIQKEIDSINIDPFTFNDEGQPININKRYFAKKMELEESNFKKRLSRLRK